MWIVSLLQQTLLQFIKLILGPDVFVHLQDTKMASPYCTLYISLDNLNTAFRSDLKNSLLHFSENDSKKPSAQLYKCTSYLGFGSRWQLVQSFEASTRLRK